MLPFDGWGGAVIESARLLRYLVNSTHFLSQFCDTFISFQREWRGIGPSAAGREPRRKFESLPSAFKSDCRLLKFPAASQVYPVDHMVHRKIGE
jgi:hypothetical protein